MAQIIIAGVTVGFVYALVALSFAPSYASSRVINFGQGELVMLGAMLGAVLIGGHGWTHIVALPVILLVVAAVNGLMYVAMIRPLRLRGASLIIIIVGTLAGGELIRVAVSFAFGLDPRAFPAPFDGPPFRILGTVISRQFIVVVLGVVVVLALVWLLYARSLVGLTVRATAEQRATASLIGIDVERLTAGTFLVSGALAGLAGFLYGPLANANPTSGFQFALWGFTALIVGGVGSWVGPVIAGVGFGVLEKLMGYWFGDGYSLVVSLAVLLLFLYVRPQGILGRHESEVVAA